MSSPQRCQIGAEKFRGGRNSGGPRAHLYLDRSTTARRDTGRKVRTDERADRLAALARSGDAEAFEDLCRLLRDDVWRYTFSLLGDREQAFDATQETFLRSVTAIRSWRGDGPVRIFLLVIARRVVSSIITAEQRRRRLEEPQELPDVPARDLRGSVEVAEVIAGLAEDQREAFVLTQVLGMTYEEAAEAQGVAIGTIRSRVSRGRAHLAEVIRAADRS